jgi:hypothetical protein
MNSLKFFAPLALSVVCAVGLAQSPASQSGISRSTNGTTSFLITDADVTGELFPDTEPNDLLIDALPGQTVRIGVGNGDHSTVQITSHGENVSGTFSLNDIPVTQSATAPSGACTRISWTLSNDGHITFCNGHLYVTKI